MSKYIDVLGKTEFSMRKKGYVNIEQGKVKNNPVVLGLNYRYKYEHKFLKNMKLYIS